LFLGKADGESGRGACAVTEISCVENFAKCFFVRQARSSVRAYGEHWTCCATKNFFGDRAENEFADAAATAGAEDDEVGTLGFGNGFDDVDYAALHNDDVAGESRIVFVQRTLKIIGFFFEVLVDDWPNFSSGKRIAFRCFGVDGVELGAEFLGKTSCERKRGSGGGRKIRGEKNVVKFESNGCGCKCGFHNCLPDESSFRARAGG